MIKQRLIIFLLLFSLGTYAQEECLLDKTPVQDLVQDYANVLSDGEEQSLRQQLIQFNDTTSTQILIVTVNSLCGYDKASFTYTLGEKWGVGDEKFNNGIVIMVKPNGRKGDRHTFIATGYGLEGVLPDAISKRIVENEMIPQFKNNDFFGGISAAATKVMEITSGEYSADDYQKSNAWKSLLPFVFVILFFLLIFSLKVGQARKYAHTNGMGFWAAWALMSTAGRSHGGSWGNFSSGGGSFGGFGGGSFGGGGAGGSW